MAFQIQTNINDANEQRLQALIDSMASRGQVDPATTPQQLVQGRINDALGTLRADYSRAKLEDLKALLDGATLAQVEAAIAALQS